MINQLKSFLMRGNVLDLAVGVIIGTAFGKIVTVLVEKMIMPVVGVLMGGINFSGMSIKILDAEVGYGAFIQAVVDFCLVGVALFIMLKAAGQKPGPPALTTSEELLTEIRDLLRQQNAQKNTQ